MNRTCTICGHGQRHDIEGALIRRDSYRAIATSAFIDPFDDTPVVYRAYRSYLRNCYLMVYTMVRETLRRAVHSRAH